MVAGLEDCDAELGEPDVPGGVVVSDRVPGVRVGPFGFVVERALFPPAATPMAAMARIAAPNQQIS